MLFVYYLVGGTWLVRHRPLVVESGTLYDDGVAKGPVTGDEAARAVGSSARLTAAVGTEQPCGLRFRTDDAVAFASRFVASSNAAWPEVRITLRATCVAAPDLGRLAPGMSQVARRLCSRLPADLMYAVKDRPIGTAEELATEVFAAIPRLLGASERAELTAAATAESRAVRAACGWFQAGYATPEAPTPDALGKTARSQQEPPGSFGDAWAFGRLLGAMVDTARPSGEPADAGKYCLDREALLCLDAAPLSRAIAATLFGDGCAATSTAAWFAGVRACTIAAPK
jgi:hypothetical protein